MIFNLNGLIAVQIEGPDAYQRYFANEYQRIHKPGPDFPKVRLIICDEMPLCKVEEIRFKKLFRFRYAVRDRGDSAEIYVQRHWLDWVYLTAFGSFIQGQLLEPVIYWKLLQRGVLLMHAAGVSRDGQAFVFPAHGGTGKTTLSMSLANQGYELLGDDLLMVDVGSGTVYPYVRPLHLFTYNLKSLKVPLSIRTAIWTKNLIRLLLQTITRERFLISTRAHAEDVIPSVKFGSPSKLCGLYFLTKDEDRAVTLDSPRARQEVANAIILSADLNDSLKENVTAEFEEVERDVVTRLLHHLNNMRFVKRGFAFATPVSPARTTRWSH